MIKTRGYRVSPDEIEQALPIDALVESAVAVGVSDPTLGERIVLFVVSGWENVEAQVLACCRRELPAYMVPSEVRRLESLPLGANGKVDRKQLARSIEPRDSEAAA